MDPDPSRFFVWQWRLWSFFRLYMTPTRTKTTTGTVSGTSLLPFLWECTVCAGPHCYWSGTRKIDCKVHDTYYNNNWHMESHIAITFSITTARTVRMYGTVLVVHHSTKLPTGDGEEVKFLTVPRYPTSCCGWGLSLTGGLILWRPGLAPLLPAISIFLKSSTWLLLYLVY